VKLFSIIGDYQGFGGFYCGHLQCRKQYSSILKMEAICFSETLVDIYQTTRRDIPEDSNLHSDCSGNLTLHKVRVLRGK
jgi:hypothetical protein